VPPRRPEAGFERLDLSIALAGNLMDRERVGEERPLGSVTELRAAKMDSVARLIAGISENLETILPSVSLLGEIALGGLEEKDPRRPRAEQALNDCHRTVAMLRQLQAVGRRQSLEPRVMSFNDTVLETLQLLRTVLAENIEVETELTSHQTLIRADPALLEQALLHLIVNARDAMPDGGRLTLRTEVVNLGEDHPSPGSIKGPHVRVSVIDTGHGMDGETMGLLFEPFFSTKERGAGLGLAVVYGIVSQSGGEMEVESRPGEGSTFAIYVPSLNGGPA
jgi:signal transduction histidine kinase